MSATANTFIKDGERLKSRPDASRDDTVKAELATAARYDKLAADLLALDVQSSELAAEVKSYRELAEHSAASLRAVATAFGKGDFEAARQKRIELDAAARGEGPLVERINRICGTAHVDGATADAGG